MTPKTTGARVELSEQELALWPNDVDKLSPSDNLPRGSRAHITLGCAGDVEAVQTGIDLLEIVRQEKGGSRGEEVGELSRGKLYSLGSGRWMLNLAKKMEVRAIFTGYYGKGKAVPIRSGRKGGSFQSCTIIWASWATCPFFTREGGGEGSIPLLDLSFLFFTQS